jgi:hypothetical protein
MEEGIEDNNYFGNINIIVNYVKEYYLQILLLLLVVIIIYITDHVSKLNALIYGTTQIYPIITNNINEKSEKKINKSKSKKVNK